MAVRDENETIESLTVLLEEAYGTNNNDLPSVGEVAEHLFCNGVDIEGYYEGTNDFAKFLIDKSKNGVIDVMDIPDLIVEFLEGKIC